jgi:hypothetical protein
MKSLASRSAPMEHTRLPPPGSPVRGTAEAVCKCHPCRPRRKPHCPRGTWPIAAVREGKGNTFGAPSSVKKTRAGAWQHPRFGGLSVGSGAAIFYQGQVTMAPSVIAARHDRTGRGIDRAREYGPCAQSCRRIKASALPRHALPSNVPHITGDDWKPCKHPNFASNSA